MMIEMKSPGDLFGVQLRKLRKARGFGAIALSKKVARGVNHIGDLERNPDAIPRRDVLLRVIEVLDLSGEDRELLLMLADRRVAPDGGKDSYTIIADPDKILFEALLRMDHDWPAAPTRPNPHSERAQLLLDAVAWVLAEVAVVETNILPPFSGIRWPEPLRRLGIVPDVDTDDAVEPAPELIEEELPFVDQLTENLTPMDAYTQSIGMARVYRRMLFSNTDFARELLSVLELWEYGRSQRLHECISLIFRSRALDEVYGFRDVSSTVIIDVAQRSLALVLWSGGQTRRQPIPWWLDLGLNTGRALLDLSSKRSTTNYDWGMGLRQAIVCIRSRTWPHEVEAIRNRFGYDKNKVAKVEEQLRIGKFGDETDESLDTDYWPLGCVDQQVLLRYARSLEARVPAPDDFVLWTPGTPFPEGHPLWKPGETTLVPRSAGEAETLKTDKEIASTKKSRKSKTAKKKSPARKPAKKKGSKRKLSKAKGGKRK